MSAQPIERTLSIPTEMARDLLEAYRAATAAALATRQPLDDEAIEEIAERHGVSDVALLKEAAALYLLRTTVQRQVDPREMQAIISAFVRAAETVAPHIEEELQARRRR